jgi:hypothetical protein
MPPNEALKERRAASAVAKAPLRREDNGRTRLTLVNAVQDAQRTRRKRAPLKRLATIVPVSDYRDVVG